MIGVADKLKSKKIGNFRVYYQNEDEFKLIYTDVFKNLEYKFFTKNKTPFIIDGGSHIGLSILYFKQLYPDSTIIGFEPNPKNFKILQKNIKENKLSNVEVFNFALSDKKGITNLLINIGENYSWTSANTINTNLWGKDNTYNKIPVKTCKLSKYIDRQVDFLKMDIEGVEQMVLEEIKNKLDFIKEIRIEFHETKTSYKENNFLAVKKILEQNKFKVIKSAYKINAFDFPIFVPDFRETTTVFLVKAQKYSNKLKYLFIK